MGMSNLKCTVDTCHYWGSGNHCTADGIEVNNLKSRLLYFPQCNQVKHQQAKIDIFLHSPDNMNHRGYLLHIHTYQPLCARKSNLLLY